MSVTVKVSELRDGDEFSLDSGRTWFTCCIPLFGSVAVYVSDRRDDEAPIIRIDAAEDDLAIVRNRYEAEPVRPHATVRDFSTFCFCPTPKLDSSDVCRKCGTQWTETRTTLAGTTTPVYR